LPKIMAVIWSVARAQLQAHAAPEPESCGREHKPRCNYLYGHQARHISARPSSKRQFANLQDLAVQG
jgi:hypothetical protein